MKKSKSNKKKTEKTVEIRRRKTGEKRKFTAQKRAIIMRWRWWWSNREGIAAFKQFISPSKLLLISKKNKFCLLLLPNFKHLRSEFLMLFNLFYGPENFELLCRCQSFSSIRLHLVLSASAGETQIMKFFCTNSRKYENLLGFSCQQWIGHAVGWLRVEGS